MYNPAVLTSFVDSAKVNHYHTRMPKVIF